MRFAFHLINFDYFGDASLVADLVHEAEESGCSDVFLTDNVNEQQEASFHLRKV